MEGHSKGQNGLSLDPRFAGVISDHRVRADATSDGGQRAHLDSAARGACDCARASGWPWTLVGAVRVLSLSAQRRIGGENRRWRETRMTKRTDLTGTSSGLTMPTWRRAGPDNEATAGFGKQASRLMPGGIH